MACNRVWFEKMITRSIEIRSKSKMLLFCTRNIGGSGLQHGHTICGQPAMLQTRRGPDDHTVIPCPTSCCSCELGSGKPQRSSSASCHGSKIKPARGPTSCCSFELGSGKPQRSMERAASGSCTWSPQGRCLVDRGLRCFSHCNGCASATVPRATSCLEPLAVAASLQASNPLLWLELHGVGGWAQWP